MAEESMERFRPTSGRIMGVIALLIVAVVVVVSLVDREHGFPMPVVWAALAVGVLVWAAMLRPGVWVTSDSLVMRNMLDTRSLPLAAIEQVVVRQVLAVRVGDRRHVSPAIGKSWRQTLKSSRATDADAPTAVDSYPVFVEERINRLAEDARAKAGVRRLSDEQLELAAGARRHWAWPEIIALSVCVVGFAVSLVS